MSTAATAVQAHLLRSPDNTFRQLPPVHIRSSSFGGRRLVVTALKSPNSNSNSNADDPSQDNLKFLLKLGAGSFAGAAVIKYGSVIVPEITQPNITLALIMIITPVIVSVLVLIKESTVKQ